MKAVSEVISIILILMITIAIAGLAYTFMSSTMSETTSAASSAVTSTTSSMATSFTIESMDVAKVYIRNIGQTTLTNLSVYVNDEPAIFNITPSAIAAGQVGTVTIYSFIPDGGTIKVTSANGFSASKVADECSKAVGCWKFDEGSGTTAYDSSPYGNTGTLTNGTNWTTGRYGNGLQFDGVDDYVRNFDESKFDLDYITVSAWIYVKGNNTFFIASKRAYGGGTTRAWELMINPGPNVQFLASTDGTINNYMLPSANIEFNRWYYVVATYNGTLSNLYINGNLTTTSAVFPGTIFKNNNQFVIGRQSDVNGGYFNGTIDEVRIYNRAIY